MQDRNALGVADYVKGQLVDSNKKEDEDEKEQECEQG